MLSMVVCVSVSHTSTGTTAMLEGCGRVHQPSRSSQRAVAAGGEIEGRERPLVAAHALEGDEVHHAGAGLHAIRQRLRQRAVDQRRHEMPHGVAAAGGERRLRIEDAPRRREHRDRRDRAGVVGDVRQQQRLDGVQRHRVRVAEGHVDGGAHAARGAREIVGDAVALHVDAHDVVAGAVEALDLDVVAVGALAELADLGAHGRLGLAADGARQRRSDRRGRTRP